MQHLDEKASALIGLHYEPKMLKVVRAYDEARRDADTDLMEQCIDELADIAGIPLEEGIYDPFILKAVFMAGGPGSGKGFYGGKLFRGTGVKVVNSDNQFERFMKQAGLSLKKDVGGAQAQEIRPRAKKVTKAKLRNLADNRIGLVIDGTAKDPIKVLKQKKQLESLGYDTAMVLVNTSLETAKERNQQRERTVPDEIVTKGWQQVQDARRVYKQEFGSSYYEIDGNNILDADEVERVLNPKMANMGQKILAQPLRNPVGWAWLVRTTKELEIQDPRKVTHLGKVGMKRAQQLAGLRESSYSITLDDLMEGALSEATFKQSLKTILAGLEKKGWDVQTKNSSTLRPLKVPHATYQNEVRLYFKAQSIYMAMGNLSMSSAHSLESDYRGMTADDVLKSLGRMHKELAYLSEAAPPDAPMERFIKKIKSGRSAEAKAFRERYGDDWKSVLYGTAWNVHKNRDESELTEAQVAHKVTDSSGKTVPPSSWPKEVLKVYRELEGAFERDAESGEDDRMARAPFRDAIYVSVQRSEEGMVGPLWFIGDNYSRSGTMIYDQGTKKWYYRQAHDGSTKEMRGGYREARANAHAYLGDVQPPSGPAYVSEGKYDSLDPTPFDSPEQVKRKAAMRAQRDADAKAASQKAMGPMKALISKLSDDEKAVIQTMLKYIPKARRDYARKDFGVTNYDEVVERLKTRGILNSRGALVPKYAKMLKALSLSDRADVFESLDEAKSLVASIASVLTDKPLTLEQIAKALGIPATGVSKQGYSMSDLKDQLDGMTRSHLHAKGKRAKKVGGGYIAEDVESLDEESGVYAVVAGAKKSIKFKSREELLKWAKKNDFDHSGDHKARGRLGSAPILQGAPKLNGLLGPMNNGDHIRYETPAGYASYSESYARTSRTMLDSLDEAMRLTKSDRQVIADYLDKKAGDSKNLTSTGKRLDGNWMGGRGIAAWTPDGKIAFEDLGSKAAQTVQAAIRKVAPKNWILESEDESPPHWEPPQDFFSRPAEEIAAGLKEASNSQSEAMSRLARAGLGSTRESRARLDYAAELLPTLYTEGEDALDEVLDFSSAYPDLRVMESPEHWYSEVEVPAKDGGTVELYWEARKQPSMFAQGTSNWEVSFFIDSSTYNEGLVAEPQRVLATVAALTGHFVRKARPEQFFVRGKKDQKTKLFRALKRLLARRKKTPYVMGGETRAFGEDYMTFIRKDIADQMGESVEEARGPSAGKKLDYLVNRRNEVTIFDQRTKQEVKLVGSEGEALAAELESAESQRAVAEILSQYRGMLESEEPVAVDEDLRDWFREKWVDISRENSDGSHPPCGRSGQKEGGYPKCVPLAKAQAMSDKEKKSAVARKRRSGQPQDGKPTNVSTAKEESVDEGKNEPTDPALWKRATDKAREKYDVYPSAYANGWAARWYKEQGGGWRTKKESVEESKTKEFILQGIEAGAPNFRYLMGGESDQSCGNCAHYKAESGSVGRCAKFGHQCLASTTCDVWVKAASSSISESEVTLAAGALRHIRDNGRQNASSLAQALGVDSAQVEPVLRRMEAEELVLGLGGGFYSVPEREPSGDETSALEIEHDTLREGRSGRSRLGKMSSKQIRALMQKLYGSLKKGRKVKPPKEVAAVLDADPSKVISLATMSKEQLASLADHLREESSDETAATSFTKADAPDFMRVAQALGISEDVELTEKDGRFFCELPSHLAFTLEEEPQGCEA